MSFQPTGIRFQPLPSAGAGGVSQAKLEEELAGYFKLAGREPAQVAAFGTAASAEGRLTSTTNATKGKILFGESAFVEKVNTEKGEGDQLGLGTATPAAMLHIKGRTPTESATAGKSALPGIKSEAGEGGRAVGSAAALAGGTGGSHILNSAGGGFAENTKEKAASSGGTGGAQTFNTGPGGEARASTGAVATGGKAGGFAATSGAGGNAQAQAGAKPKECKGGGVGAFTFSQAEGGKGTGGETARGGLPEALFFKAGSGGTATGVEGETKTCVGGSAAVMRFSGGKGGQALGASENATGGNGTSIEFVGGEAGAASGGTVTNTEGKTGTILFKTFKPGNTAGCEVLLTNEELKLKAEKVGLYSTAPVAQHAAIPSPLAELAALKTCCDELREAIKLIGVTL